MRSITHVLPALCAIAALATGCSHDVTIDTEPSGGEIRVDGKKLGKAPVTYTESSGWSNEITIEARKSGFAPTKQKVKQSEFHMPLLIGSICAGIACAPTFIGLGFFAGIAFSRVMPDNVVVELEKGGADGGGGDDSSALEPVRPDRKIAMAY